MFNNNYKHSKPFVPYNFKNKYAVEEKFGINPDDIFDIKNVSPWQMDDIAKLPSPNI